MQSKSNEDFDQPDYDAILQKQDFFPKIFLMPSQIRLDSEKGLRVIKRYQSHQDKFQEEDIKPIITDPKLIKRFNEQDEESDKKNSVGHPAGHGLLSLFKRTPQRRIKLAICICVYSEPKYMLKSTIKGIQQSYKYFLEKAGILPHEIIMVVIFDGIEKVNSSKDQTENMISFFTEIDIKNGFTYKPYAKSLQDFIREVEEKKGNLSILKEDKLDEVSLFTEQELMNLQHKLFQNQHSEYLRIQELLKEVKKLKRQTTIRLDSLPSDVYKRYEELCLNFCIENNMWFETQEEIQEFISAKKNEKVKLVFEALNDTERLCKKYLQSRQKTSILYPVRMETDDLRGPPKEGWEPKPEEKKEFNYMFFCVKHKNQGKLSSHMMFFEGFCKLFDPQYCILTDVGVQPQKDAIYKMWQHMQKNPKCGGVCGYMGLRLQSDGDEFGYRSDGFDRQHRGWCTKFCNCFLSIQRAQQFEYHYAHMLDKPFESFFNYIHVLPGAFSGYRWKALKSISYKSEEISSQALPETERYSYYFENEDLDEEYETLMKRYLKTASSRQIHLSLEDTNMYLAEDRIMCLCIHALGYDIHYLPDAQSYVDPVTSLTRLMGQRRRWINGSWFAFNYVRGHSSEVGSCIFYIQLLYYSLIQKLTWVAVSIFYVTMNLLLVTAVREYVTPMLERFFLTTEDYELSNYKFWIFNVKNIADSLPDIVNFVFILYVFAIALFSSLVNHNNPRFKKIYYAASTLFGIYGISIFVLLVYNTTVIFLEFSGDVQTEDFIINITVLRWLILVIIIAHALPILWTFSFRKGVEMVTSLFSYLFYIPTFINILYIFAFCRIDDLSWGTKGLDQQVDPSAEQLQQRRQWNKKKYIFVLQFISLNTVLSYVLVRMAEFDSLRNGIILGLTILILFLIMFRLVFAFFYLLKYYLKKPWKKIPDSFRNRNLENGQKILNALRAIENKMKEIEKIRTKRKKEEEYKRLANATSFIISKTLSNYGSRVRSKVAQHLVNNNMLPRKELLKPQKKSKNKKRLNFKKGLKSVTEDDEQNIQNPNLPADKRTHRMRKEEDDSMARLGYGREESQSEVSDDESLIVPQKRRSDIKARIEAIKGKKRKSEEQKQSKGQ